MTDGAAAYRRAAIATASPTGLIALLLRRLVDELDHAARELEGLSAGTGGDGAPETGGAVGGTAPGERQAVPGEAVRRTRERLRLAQEILTTLRTSLRHDLEADLPARLDAIYDFAYWRAVEAHSRLDAEACRAALDAVRPVQTAWDAVFHG